MVEGPPFSIRRAAAGDAPALLSCLREAFEPFRRQYMAEGFADTVLDSETIRRRLAEMTLFVAENGSGEVLGTIGCAAVSPAEGHIRGMAIRPAWQGRGIAERLLAAAESELRARGCSRVSLDTTAPLKRAVRFYEKNGYRATGKVGDFFGMPLFEYVKLLR